MSQWEVRVKEHQVWRNLDSIGPMIDSCLSHDGIDPETIAGLERIRLVITAIGRRLAATDPLLISPNQLNGFNSPLERVFSELQSYQVNKVAGHIINANTYIDECLGLIGQIAGTITADDLSVLSSSASNFRSTINRYLKDLTKTLDELSTNTNQTKAKADDLAVILLSEQQRVATTLSDIQTQFNNSQNQRSSEFTLALNEATSKLSTQLDTQRTELSKLQNEQQNQLSNLLAIYSTQLSDHQIKFEKEASDLKVEFNDNLKNLHDGHVVVAEKIVDEVKKQQQRVESLVGVIGNIGVSSGFLNVANYARKMVWIWQGLTVVSLIGLIVVSFFVAFPSMYQSFSVASVSTTTPKTINTEIQLMPEKKLIGTVKDTEVTFNSDSKFIQGFLSKLFLSITFGIFAAYSARQGRRFLDMEQKNRQKALELEALGPFIEPLDKADRDKFRVQVGDRSFGLPDDFSREHKDSDPTSLLAILKQNDIVESVTKIIKAAKN